MKTTLAILATVATVGATAVAAPAPAEAGYRSRIGLRLGGGRISCRCGSERVSVLWTGLRLL
jgi:hypothetical protein